MAFDKRCCCIIISVIAALAIIIFILLICKLILSKKKYNTKGGFETTGYRYLASYDNEAKKYSKDYDDFQYQNTRMITYNTIDILTNVLIEYESKLKFSSNSEVDDLNFTQIGALIKNYETVVNNNNIIFDKSISGKLTLYSSFRNAIVETLNDSTQKREIIDHLLSVIPTIVEYLYLSLEPYKSSELECITGDFVDTFIIDKTRALHLLRYNPQNMGTYDKWCERIRKLLTNESIAVLLNIEDSRLGSAKIEYKYPDTFSRFSKLEMDTLWFTTSKCDGLVDNEYVQKYFNTNIDEYTPNVNFNPRSVNSLIKYLLDLSKALYELGIQYNNWNCVNSLCYNTCDKYDEFKLLDFTIMPKDDTTIKQLSDDEYNKVLDIIKAKLTDGSTTVPNYIPCLTYFISQLLLCNATDRNTIINNISDFIDDKFVSTKVELKNLHELLFTSFSIPLETTKVVFTVNKSNAILGIDSIDFNTDSLEYYKYEESDKDKLKIRISEKIKDTNYDVVNDILYTLDIGDNEFVYFKDINKKLVDSAKSIEFTARFKGKGTDSISSTAIDFSDKVNVTISDDVLKTSIANYLLTEFSISDYKGLFGNKDLNKKLKADGDKYTGTLTLDGTDYVVTFIYDKPTPDPTPDDSLDGCFRTTAFKDKNDFVNSLSDVEPNIDVISALLKDKSCKTKLDALLYLFKYNDGSDDWIRGWYIDVDTDADNKITNIEFDNSSKNNDVLFDIDSIEEDKIITDGFSKSFISVTQDSNTYTFLNITEGTILQRSSIKNYLGKSVNTEY